MKSLVRHSPRTLRWEKRPDPEPQAGEVLIAVKASGICGTDAHLAAGRLDPWKTPIVLGHEVAGVVARVGPEVDRISAGSRVVCHHHLPCDRCFSCTAGQANLCDSPKFFMGFQNDGGFADVVVVPAECAVPLPPELDFTSAAPVACASTTAVRAMANLSATPENALVIGGGPVGIQCVQLLRRSGATVACCSRSERKLERALRAGATRALRAGERPKPQYDLVIDTVATPETFEFAMGSVAKLGRISLLGFGGHGLRFDPGALIPGRISIDSSCGALKADLELALSLAAGGALDSYVASVVPPAELPAALWRIETGDYDGKTVVDMES